MKYNLVTDFKLNILMLILSEICMVKKYEYYFTDCIKRIDFGLHSDIYDQFGSNLVSDVYRYYWTLHFDSHLSDLHPDSMSQMCKKAKITAQIIWLSSQWIWMNFGRLLRLLSLMDLMLNVSHQI